MEIVTCPLQAILLGAFDEESDTKLVPDSSFADFEPRIHFLESWFDFGYRNEIIRLYNFADLASKLAYENKSFKIAGSTPKKPKNTELFNDRQLVKNEEYLIGDQTYVKIEETPTHLIISIKASVLTRSEWLNKDYQLMKYLTTRKKNVPWIIKEIFQSYKLVERAVLKQSEILKTPLNGVKTLERISITGHSLSGAYAVLLGIDLSKRESISKIQVFVYTFGGPRIGNRNFDPKEKDTELLLRHPIAEYIVEQDCECENGSDKVYLCIGGTDLTSLDILESEVCNNKYHESQLAQDNGPHLGPYFGHLMSEEHCVKGVS
ncbi:hypothetical protein G9A89_007264 [Geosiphon pyriformis]|nr:hypothetical protein G9A89_007264 [Geosiphon pyriformis]